MWGIDGSIAEAANMKRPDVDDVEARFVDRVVVSRAG